MRLAFPRPVFAVVFAVLGLALACGLLLFPTHAQQTPPATIVMCVNANVAPGGAGDGTSWPNAFASLDAALAAAPDIPNGAELWVAEGNYKPTNQTTGFLITKHLRLYGGFVGDGTENSVESRHGSFQRTFLNGDIGTVGFQYDNAYHVVSIDLVDGEGEDPGVVIDGFRIANGFFLGIGSFGAGIWCHCSDLDVANCYFDHNHGYDGGAIGFVSGCAEVPPPPAVEPGITSILRVKSCEFFANLADQRGGAIFGERLRGWVQNTKFLTNRATVFGGAVFEWRVKTAYSFDFANCVFWENFAEQTAISTGGAISFHEAGGGAGESARSNVVNCTFAGNYASSCLPGQAVSVSPNSVVGIYNSILYYNHDICGTFCNTSNSPPIAGFPLVEYSDVEYGWTTSGGQNIASPPLFTAGSPPPTSFDIGCAIPPSAVLPALTLKRAVGSTAGSKCIDHADYSRLPLDFGDLDQDGDFAEVIPVDLLEASRWVDRHGTGEDPNLGAPSGGIDYTDMGAYERP